MEIGRREATVGSIEDFVDRDARTRYLKEYALDIVDAFHDDGESFRDVRQRVYSMLIAASDADKTANAVALMFVAIKHREKVKR